MIKYITHPLVSANPIVLVSDRLRFWIKTKCFDMPAGFSIQNLHIPLQRGKTPSQERLLLLVLGVFLFLFNANAKDAYFFYAGVCSNGVWLGESANDHKTVASDLSVAIQTIRAARKELEADSRVTLLLHGGTYELAAPLVLTPEDSGLTIAAYDNETPVISGGRKITGWKEVPGKPAWWETEIPSVKDGHWYFRSLFVNDRRAQRARTPNAGSFLLMQGTRFGDEPIKFQFKSGDIKSEWASDPDIELVGFEKWISYRLRIRALNTESNSVQLSGGLADYTHEDGGGRYYIENTMDALDAPGEWFLNRNTGVLTYIALPGEDLTSLDVFAPRLNNLVLLQGNFTAKHDVQHVTLRRLTFSHTDWEMPANGFIDGQGAADVFGDVRAEAATGCVIENCTFKHLANYAVELGRGCQQDKVIGCDMTDLGAGGVRVGEGKASPDDFWQNYSHSITDNHIHDAGKIYPAACGILIMLSGTNLVAHNEIDHIFYSAISCGWVWGYEKSPCCENIIEFNNLHDIGQSMMSDLGAVYTLGPQKGTIVRNNLIHDVESFSYGGWGLYTDEGSSDITFENNIVYNTKTGGFHQHFGQNNLIRNNIFADSRQWQLQFTRVEDHRSFTFENNIVYWTQGALFGGSFDKGQILMTSNLYWNASGQPVNFAPIGLEWQGKDINTMIVALAKNPVTNLKQWQAQGHDQGSIVADPNFVAPDKFDFTLKPGSPALKMGFKPIDLTGVGIP
jgi:parallel beta-helix repeat protein